MESNDRDQEKINAWFQQLPRASNRSLKSNDAAAAVGQQQAITIALRSVNDQNQLLRQRLVQKESQVDQLTRKLESVDKNQDDDDDDFQARMSENFLLLQKRLDEKEAQVDQLTRKLDSFMTTARNGQQQVMSSPVEEAAMAMTRSSSKHITFRDDSDVTKGIDVDMDELVERNNTRAVVRIVAPVDEEGDVRDRSQLQTSNGSSRSVLRPTTRRFNRRSDFRNSFAMSFRGARRERRPVSFSPQEQYPWDDVEDGEDDDDDELLDMEKRNNSSILKKKDDDDDHDGELERSLHIHEVFRLPEDVFTMMFFADHCSASFLYGCFVFVFQIVTLSILLTDLTSDELLPEGEFDRNKLNVPIQVDWQVHIARIIAVLVTVISRDDCLDTFWIVSIGHKGRWQRIFPGATMPDFVMMNVLRFAEGAYTIVISFIVAVQSETVIDLFLNFAAIEFVANLDNLAYMLAKTGWLTRSMTELTERIDNETEIFLNCRDREKLKRTEPIKYVLMIVMLVGLYAGLYRIYSIEQDGLLVKDVSCEKLIVTFGEQMFKFSSAPADSLFKGFETTTKQVSNQTTLRSLVGSTRPLFDNFDALNPPDALFSHFSGQYEGFYDLGDRVNDRPIYYEGGLKDPTAGKFYYCLAEKAWVFTIEAFGSYNAVPKPTQDRCGTDGWLIRSPVTDAFVLEQVPSEGWKAWTGTFEEIETFQIHCATCSSDIDCSVVRGICGDRGRCECHDGYTGTFCEADAPCEYLASYTEGRPKILKKALYTYSNKRPIYYLDVDKDDEKDRKLDESRRGKDEEDEREGIRRNSLGVLLHTGTRWYHVFFSKTAAALFGITLDPESFTTKELRDLQDKFEHDFHPYWSGIRVDGTQEFSEPTDQVLPTGPLVWKSFLESHASGNYGVYGAVKDITRSFECLSVDCGADETICGRFGECTEVDNIVVFGGTFETGIAGNQCVCTKEQATGHYCEFYNFVEWDENGTITEGPYELDPFQAGCYGPLRNLTDCVEKLYPDFEKD